MSALERAVAGVRVATVTDVNLTFEGIGDAGATQLADAVRDNNSAVKELKLAGNSIGDWTAAVRFGPLRFEVGKAWRSRVVLAVSLAQVAHAAGGLARDAGRLRVAPVAALQLRAPAHGSEP